MTYVTYAVSVTGKKAPGRRPDNQDRVLSRTIDVSGTEAALLVVADGVTTCPFGGSVARWVVERHLAVDTIPFVPGVAPLESLQVYLKDLHAHFYAEFAAGPEGFTDSGASLSLALLHHGVADCLWAGDSPIYASKKHAKGFTTEMISRPDQDVQRRLTNVFGAGSPFDLRHRRIDLSEGDIVTVTSDGVTVDEDSLSGIFGTKGLSRAALDELVRLSTRGRCWDDISVVAGQFRAPGSGARSISATEARK